MVAAGAKYFLRSGDPVRQFVFFISSGSDVVPQRNLFEGMIDEASTQFRLRPDQNRRFVFAVDRWEQDAPRRTSDMNAEFVRRAKNAHATVVLLAEEVRKGTREEIEGVLEEPEVQLSVIWMESETSRRKSARLKKFLREHQDSFAYYRTDEPGSHESILAMVKVLTASLADVTSSDRHEELFHEVR